MNHLPGCWGPCRALGNVSWKAIQVDAKQYIRNAAWAQHLPLTNLARVGFTYVTEKGKGKGKREGERNSELELSSGRGRRTH